MSKYEVPEHWQPEIKMNRESKWEWRIWDLHTGRVASGYDRCGGFKISLESTGPNNTYWTQRGAKRRLARYVKYYHKYKDINTHLNDSWFKVDL